MRDRRLVEGEAGGARDGVNARLAGPRLQDTKIFRREVYDHLGQRLYGDVHLGVPISWQVIGALLFAAVVGSLVFLSLAQYSRIVAVTGEILPERGVIAMMPSRPGMIQRIGVTLGEHVSLGQPLVQIGSDERLADGSAASARVIAALALQQTGLQLQRQQMMAAMLAEQGQIEAKLAGLRQDLIGLGEQFKQQQQLVDTAKEEFDLAKRIAANGFVSRHDLQLREEALLSRRQQLVGLRRSIEAEQAAIQQAEREKAAMRASGNVRIAALTGQGSDIVRQQTTAQAEQAYQLKAPVAGVVAALVAKSGQIVNAGQEILSIVPDHSPFVAELYVPSAAIGFVAAGQQVGLALDAYPYERFGRVEARIRSVSNASVTLRDGKGKSGPFYLVTASLASASITAFGRQRAFMPGMTLTANIVAEKQSLLRWLFEPLFAAQRR